MSFTPTRRLVTVTLWLMVVPFLAWAMVRLLGLERGFPAVQLIAFTPYVLLASLVPLVAAVLTRRLWPALVVAFAALVLGTSVLPRWVADRDDVTPAGPRLRVLSVNLLMGQADSATVVRLARDWRVDLVAFQEYTPGSSATLHDAGLRELLPHRVGYPVDGVVGSAVYSRFPLTDEGLRKHGSGFGQAKAAIAVPGAPVVHVESVHPCAPSGRSRSACWRAELASQPPATVDGPLRMLIGDFNATLDHGALRKLIDTGYRDAADAVGAGLTHTWPYDERWYIPAVAIDHVLADRRIGVERVDVSDIPGSDHRALFAALRLPSQN